MAARIALLVFLAPFALASAGCNTKTACSSIERNDGYSACEVYIDDCEDGRTRSVTCEVTDNGSFRCDCHVDGARRKTFTDRLVCSGIDADAYLSHLNDQCDWKLRQAEAE